MNSYREWKEAEDLLQKRKAEGICVHDEDVPVYQNTFRFKRKGKNLVTYCNTCDKVINNERLW